MHRAINCSVFSIGPVSCFGVIPNSIGPNPAGVCACAPTSTLQTNRPKITAPPRFRITLSPSQRRGPPHRSGQLHTLSTSTAKQIISLTSHETDNYLPFSLPRHCKFYVLFIFGQCRRNDTYH